MKLNKLIFDRILDFTSQNDVDNLKEAVKNTDYERFLNQRIRSKDQHPYLCHLCITADHWQKIAAIFINSEFQNHECWTLLVQTKDWKNSGVQLETQDIDSLADMTERIKDLNGYDRYGAKQFGQYMMALKQDRAKRAEVQTKLHQILKNLTVFTGARELIEHFENAHSDKKSVIDVYNAILDQHGFDLTPVDVRESLNPNSFVAIHKRSTFLTIGSAYLMNDVLKAPLNKHRELKSDVIPLVALRDLLEKTEEAYKQLILFKPPYESSNSVTDEYYRERLRIKHCRIHLAILHNCSSFLNLIVPYRY